MVVGSTTELVTVIPEFGRTPDLEDPTLELLDFLLRPIFDWLWGNLFGVKTWMSYLFCTWI